MERTRGNFTAKFGDEHTAMSKEFNLKYCVQPVTEMLEQYNKLVDDANLEIYETHRMLDAKQLDIAKLASENNKFLLAAADKQSWM